MNKLQLYVKGQRVELFKDEEITITQSVKKLQDIKTVFTDYTQDFSVPASKSNMQIFKHLHRGDIANSLDVRKRAEADILLNGVLFKRGYIVFRDAQVVNGKVISYKLYFVGGLGHLKQKLGDRKIGDLDFTSDETTQDYSSVIDGLGRSRSSVIDGSLFDMLYSLITADGGYYYSDDDSYPENAVYPKNISWSGRGSGATAAEGLNYQQLKPSIRMNAIIKAIERTFAQEGVVFSNDFFHTDMTTNPEWMGLFMLMHNKKGSVTSNETTGLKKVLSNTSLDSRLRWDNAKAELIVAGNYSSTLFQNGSVWDYTAGTNSFDFLYTIKEIKFDITSSNTSAEYEVFLKDIITGDTTSITGGKVNGDQQDLIQSYNGEGQLAFGDLRIFSLYVETNEQVSLNISFTASYLSKPDVVADFYIEAGSEQTIDFRKMMPDMKVFDYLSGVFKLFNLIAYEDVNGVIKVIKYDDWRNEKNTIDITEYVNDSKYSIDLKIPYNAIDINYKESEYTDRMFRNKQLSDSGTEGEYGSFLISDSNINSSDKTFKLDLPFQLMRYKRLYHSTDETVAEDRLEYDLETDIQIGQLVDNKFDELGSKGIIYYPIQKTVSIGVNDGSILNEITTINIPSNTLDLPTVTNPKPFALPFGNYRDSWSDSIVTNGGLYVNNHYNLLSPIFNIRNKGLKLELYLPSYLLTDLSMNDDVVFKNKKYRINSLKTNLQSGKSSIELFGYSTVGFSDILKGVSANVPIITLNGADEVSVGYGDTYTDLGATATDAEDGDITANIIDDSNLIDTNVEGEDRNQVVKYEVSDSDGNTGIKYRTVIVGEPDAPIVVDWSLNSVDQGTNEYIIDYDVSSADIELGQLRFYVKLSGAVDNPSDFVLSVNAAGNFTFNGTFTNTGNDSTLYVAYMTVTAGSKTVRSGDVTITLI